MNFDYTYIPFFGYPLFEPTTFITDLLIFFIAVYCFRKLLPFRHPYSVQMSWFTLWLGISTFFGGFAHAIHLQLGHQVFAGMVFMMHAASLLSIYFCFRAAHTYSTQGMTGALKYVYLVRIWIIILLLISLIDRKFLVIKVHAALVLLYSLIVHVIAFQKKRGGGNRLIVTGILISFLPIIIHSIRFSVNAWLNYKDISHLFMMLSLIVIYRGARRNAMDLEKSVSAREATFP